MNISEAVIWLQERSAAATEALSAPFTYYQLLILAAIYLITYFLSKKMVGLLKIRPIESESAEHPIVQFARRAHSVIYPALAILLLQISIEVGQSLNQTFWLLKFAMSIALLWFFHFMVRAFVTNDAAASWIRWIGFPILLLYLTNLMPTVVNALKEVSLTAGNIEFSAYGIARVLIFGALLFWLGRASHSVGLDMIRKQETLDVRTREVFSKLYQVGLFCIVALLLLNVMGINLTALAVFGGAVGVGLGLGLQAIASNFISGIIILLDRSLTIGDFVELDDGSSGFVREFRMRYTVLESYDGKDILVPNEKFISSLLVNWTHKDHKQRYRVDFSVSYATDIRAMAEVIKTVVAEHPQVISGEDIPFEERPDCEIDSFGDSGVNMFVEFWMEGIDDGKNRVGGDLLLTIFETLRENGIEIPFPQREVRVLKDP